MYIHAFIKLIHLKTVKEKIDFIFAIRFDLPNINALFIKLITNENGKININYYNI